MSDGSTLQSSRCPTCGWAAETLHLSVHLDRCERWRKACRELGFDVRPEPELAQIIECAREDMGAADGEARYLDAAAVFVRALFERSLGHAIKQGNWREHPSYGEYAKMVDVEELGDTWSRRVGTIEGEIGPGFTLWEPGSSKARSMQFRNARRSS